MPEQLDLLAGVSTPQAKPRTAPTPSPAPPAVEPEAKADQPEDAPQASPSTLLIIDTETSGLDPQQDQCLEVGCILFDVPSRSVLAQQSFLLPVDSNAAEPINRIPAAVTRRPQPWKEAASAAVC